MSDFFYLEAAGRATLEWYLTKRVLTRYPAEGNRRINSKWKAQTDEVEAMED